jgi:hypothetical protein
VGGSWGHQRHLRLPCGADAIADDEEVAQSLLVESLLAAVLLAVEQCSCKKLISLFNYVAKNNPAAKSLPNLEILVNK